MDGKSPQRVTLEFRQNFKVGLKIAMAPGNASMITRAGRLRSYEYRMIFYFTARLLI